MRECSLPFLSVLVEVEPGASDGPYRECSTPEQVRSLFLARIQGAMMAELKLADTTGAKGQAALLKDAEPLMPQCVAMLLEVLGATEDFGG